jgi:atypical dual specificity phosphatase
MPERFSWIIPWKLAGMERPGLYSVLEDDLRFLKDSGIDIIVNLEEHFIDYDGFEVKHIPIKDFKAPIPTDFDEFVKFAHSNINDGKRIVVHCHAGMGRTNLMLASYLVYLGMEPDKALGLVREKRPYQSINEEQEEALREYSYTSRTFEK